MNKYLETFTKNGFEDLETILELRDEDFTAMGIPLGHKLKMLKRIKELKPVEQKPVPPPQPKLHGIQKVGATVVPVSNNEYAELPAPNENEEIPVKTEEIKKSTLTDSAKSKEKNKDVKKSVRFEEAAMVLEFGNENENDLVKRDAENNKENIMKLRNESKKKMDSETGDSPMNENKNCVWLKKNEEKESCWNCYKLFVKGKGYIDNLTGKVYF